MTQKKIRVFLTCLGLWLIALTCSAGKISAGKSVQGVPGEEDLVRVNIQQLIVDPATQNPVVSLTDPEEKRALFIWIGPTEARAIHAEIQGIKHFRPLTHDLLASVIDVADVKIHRIVITHVKENVFYAAILIEKNGGLFEIDARPSDSMVMALKYDAPIFVARNLFEKMSLVINDETGIEYKYGLDLQELTSELAEYLSFGPKRGVMISGVRKGSQADKDGLQAGDIFVDVGGQAADTVTSLKDALMRSKPPVEAKIFRKSRFLTVTLHSLKK
jgi:bifunctional DNase/RNase